MSLSLSLRRAGIVTIGGLVAFSAVYAIQPFREYPGVEYENFPVPPDFQEKTEWVFARLMYPPIGRFVEGIPIGRLPTPGFAFYGDWRLGGSNWTMDYPRSDRHFSTALRRLTRIHTRSVEQVINLDDNDVWDWPWLYGVEVGHWNLTDAQVKAMREFLLRGGFFMCDDFHGSVEWEVFVASMRKIFPVRPRSAYGVLPPGNRGALRQDHSCRTTGRRTAVALDARGGQADGGARPL